MAQFCQLLAWVLIVAGLLVAVFGAGDVSKNAQSGAMGIAAGVGMICSSILWFVPARVILSLIHI